MEDPGRVVAQLAGHSSSPHIQCSMCPSPLSLRPLPRPRCKKLMRMCDRSSLSLRQVGLTHPESGDSLPLLPSSYQHARPGSKETKQNRCLGPRLRGLISPPLGLKSSPNLGSVCKVRQPWKSVAREQSVGRSAALPQEAGICTTSKWSLPPQHLRGGGCYSSTSRPPFSPSPEVLGLR